MQAVVDHLSNAIEALKQEMISDISNNGTLEQHKLDALNNLRAMIAAIRQASGL